MENPKKSPELSVIIPVWGTGEKALKIGAQVLNGFDDLELILVDDGSTDDSLSILQQFALRDSRVKVFSQQNSGASSARNLGLSHAEGKYLLFLDSDDEISKNFLGSLHGVQESENPTLAFTALKQEYDGKDKIVFHYATPTPEKKPHEKTEKYLLRLLSYDGRLYPVVNKIYQRRFIKDYFDETLKLGEDLDFNLKYLKHAIRETGELKFAFPRDALYLYHYGAGSIKTAARDWGNWKKSIKATESVLGKLPLGLKLRWRGSWLKAKLGLA